MVIQSLNKHSISIQVRPGLLLRASSQSSGGGSVPSPEYGMYPGGRLRGQRGHRGKVTKSMDPRRPPGGGGLLAETGCLGGSSQLDLTGQAYHGPLHRMPPHPILHCHPCLPPPIPHAGRSQHSSAHSPPDAPHPFPIKLQDQAAAPSLTHILLISPALPLPWPPSSLSSQQTRLLPV